MAKIIFKTFQEAAAFSKNLSMTIKASTPIKRDGETWWVDDPRAEQGISQSIETDKATAQDTVPSLYDADGYDAEGYDKDGFDRDEYDREGRPKYPF